MLKHYRDRELADYDAAIKLEPANPMYRVARAETWSARGRHEPAMADYAEAIRLDPNNPGNLGLARQRVAQGPEDRHRDRRLQPGDSPRSEVRAGVCRRGNTWKQIGRFDLAIQGFSDLIRINPRNPSATRCSPGFLPLLSSSSSATASGHR